MNHWCFSPIIWFGYWFGYKPANSTRSGSTTSSLKRGFPVNYVEDTHEVSGQQTSGHTDDFEEQHSLIIATIDTDTIPSSSTSSHTLTETPVLREHILEKFTHDDPIAESFIALNRSISISGTFIETTAPYAEMLEHQEEDFSSVELLSGYSSDDEGSPVQVPGVPVPSPETRCAFRSRLSLAVDSLTVNEYLSTNSRPVTTFQLSDKPAVHSISSQSFRRSVTANDMALASVALDPDNDVDSVLACAIDDLASSNWPQTPERDVDSPTEIVRMVSPNLSLERMAVLATGESLFDEEPLDAVYQEIPEFDSPISGIFYEENDFHSNVLDASISFCWEEQCSVPSASFDDDFDDFIPSAESPSSIFLSSALSEQEDLFVVNLNYQSPPMFLSECPYGDTVDDITEEGSVIEPMFSGNDDVLLTPKVSSTRISDDLLSITVEELGLAACASPTFWTPVDAEDLTLLWQLDMDDNFNIFAKSEEARLGIGQTLTDEPWSTGNHDYDEPEHSASMQHCDTFPSSQWKDDVDFLSDAQVGYDKEEDWVISSEAKAYMKARKITFDARRKAGEAYTR